MSRDNNTILVITKKILKLKKDGIYSYNIFCSTFIFNKKILTVKRKHLHERRQEFYNKIYNFIIFYK